MMTSSQTAKKTARVFWLTGLSGSGKSTLAASVRVELEKKNLRVLIVDGDAVRAADARLLSFTEADVRWNNERIARICVERGAEADVILVPVVSPLADARRRNREIIGEGYHEIFCAAAPATVRRRDVKGLYARAERGEITPMIGTPGGMAYEAPVNPDLLLDTDCSSPEACAKTLIEYVESRLSAKPGRKDKHSAEHETIFKDFFSYVPSQFVSQFLGFFTSLLLRRFLGPYFMGVWSMLQVVMNYCSNSHLGIVSTVFYRVPILRGQGKKEELERLQNSVHSYLILLILALSACVMGYALWNRPTLPQPVFWGLVFVSAVLTFERSLAFNVILLRANKHFDVLSRFVIFDATMNLIFTIVLVGRFQYYGLLAASFLLPICNLLFIRFFRRFDLKFKISWAEIRYCLRYGFPIFVRDWLSQILNSVDRIMIVSLLGFEAVGMFSIATMTRNYSHGVYRNFSHVISPYFLEKFGEAKEWAEVKRYIEKPTLILSHFMAIVLSCAFIGSALVVGMVLPKFSSGLPALQIYLFTAAFTAIDTQATTFITAINKQVQMVPIVAVTIVANVGLNYAFIRAGWGIAGVAAATSIVSGAVFLFMYGYAMKHVESWPRILFLMLEILAPLLVSGAVLGVLDHLVLAGWSPIPRAAAEAVVYFGLVALPMVFYLNRRTGIVRIAGSVLAKRLRKQK